MLALSHGCYEADSSGCRAILLILDGVQIPGKSASLNRKRRVPNARPYDRVPPILAAAASARKIFTALRRSEVPALLASWRHSVGQEKPIRHYCRSLVKFCQRCQVFYICDATANRIQEFSFLRKIKS